MGEVLLGTQKDPVKVPASVRGAPPTKLKHPEKESSARSYGILTNDLDTVIRVIPSVRQALHMWPSWIRLSSMQHAATFFRLLQGKRCVSADFNELWRWPS